MAPLVSGCKSSPKQHSSASPTSPQGHLPCLLQGPGAKTQAGEIQVEIPTCISMFWMKSHYTSRLLVAVQGVVAMVKSGIWSPPAIHHEQGCLCPCCPPPPGCSPNTPIASRLSFGLFCFLPRSALGCYLTHIYLLVAVIFSCRSQGFQPKPRRGWPGPAFSEVSAWVKGVQGQLGNEVSDD